MVDGGNRMSLMHWYRQITDNKKEVVKQLKKLEEENRILREEVRALKELLYGIELQYTANILKR
jgi:cell division protein FtsB